MPLLDHTRSPLSPGRRWESFFAMWANTISDALNGPLLPPGYFSEIRMHLGSGVGADGATFLEVQPGRMVLPGFSPDVVQVLVYDSREGGYTLVAAVELVSPGNKDRREARSSFAAKCVTYLRDGVGLMTIDIVTSRRSNLHNEVIQLLGTCGRFLLPNDGLGAVAYRPTRLDMSRDQPSVERIELWHSDLSVGERLPTLPLGLDHGTLVPLDLEATYTEACRRSRLG